MLAAIARWVYRRRRTVLIAWLLVFVAGIGIGSGVFDRLENTNGSSSAESVKGFDILDDARTNGPQLVVLIAGADVTNAATRSAVEAATTKVSNLDYVTGVQHRFNDTNPELTSADGKQTLMLIELRNTDDAKTIVDRVDEVREQLHGSV